MATRPDSPGRYGETPNAHAAFTIHDTNELPADTIAVRVAIATAGNLVFEDWDDVEVTHHYPAVGVFVEKGSWKRVKATGATAVLSPATTVIAQRLTAGT